MQLRGVQPVSAILAAFLLWMATATGHAGVSIPANQWTRIAPAPPVHAGIMAFSGAAYDAARRQLLLFGGGHNDYHGNEVWALDLRERTWRELYPPDARERYRIDNLDHRRGKLKDSDKPYTRHTYQQLAFVPSLDGLVVWSGCGPGWGDIGTSSTPTDTWIFQPRQNLWRLLSDEAPATMGGAMCHDRQRDTLWAVGGVGGMNRWLYRFDFHTLRWSSRPLQGMTNRSWHNTLLCEARRDRLLMTAGTLAETWLIDPETARAERVETDFRPDPKGGMAHHAGIDMAVFVGRTHWAAFDFDQLRWIRLPADGLPDIGPRGVFGRLLYIPDRAWLLLVVPSGSYAIHLEKRWLMQWQ